MTRSTSHGKPTGRGGARQGQPGKAYPNRSDLNAQAIRTTPGQTYGAQTAQAQAQKVVPLGQLPPPPTPTPGQAPPTNPDQLAQALSQMPAPGSLGSVTGPTNRPTEPLTTGLPTGAGPGPEALGPQPDPTLATLTGVYQKFPSPDLLRLIQAQGQK